MKIAIFTLLFAGAACAQELKPCPEEFLAEVKIVAPAGWVGVAPRRLPLTAVDVVVGHAGNGPLIGRERKTRNGYEMTYDEISTGLPPKTGIWLACRYRDLSLAQRLPDDTDRCVVSYYRNQYNGHDISVACHVKP